MPRDVALDAAESVRLFALQVPHKGDIPALLDAVHDKSYPRHSQVYHTLVFPFFRVMSSVAYAHDPGAMIRQICPSARPMDREATQITKHTGVWYEHIKVGRSLTPSAVILWVRAEAWISCVIAVRGTHTRGDVITDAKAWQRDLVLMNADSLDSLFGSKAPPQPRVHAGFGEYHSDLAAAIIPRVLRLVASLGRPERFRFFCTGHSLGSLSVIMALTLSDIFRDRVFAFSFGAPYLGDQGFNRLLVHPSLRLRRYFRIYNRDDVITKLTTLRSLQHVDQYLEALQISIPDYHSLDVQNNLMKAVGHLYALMPTAKKLRLLHSSFSFDGDHVYT